MNNGCSTIFQTGSPISSAPSARGYSWHVSLARSRANIAEYLLFAVLRLWPSLPMFQGECVFAFRTRHPFWCSLDFQLRCTHVGDTGTAVVAAARIVSAAEIGGIFSVGESWAEFDLLKIRRTKPGTGCGLRWQMAFASASCHITGSKLVDT